MLSDILIMTYILLLAILIYQAEKLSENSLKVVLAGLLLTPVIGFALLAYYHKQLSESFE
jgi:RsiW-degrading membrane proteinase PrsW (M82 family)